MSDAATNTVCIVVPLEPLLSFLCPTEESRQRLASLVSVEPKGLYTVQEACRYLGISRPTLYRENIEFVIVGSSRKYPIEELDKYRNKLPRHRRTFKARVLKAA